MSGSKKIILSTTKKSLDTRQDLAIRIYRYLLQTPSAWVPEESIRTLARKYQYNDGDITRALKTISTNGGGRKYDYEFVNVCHVWSAEEGGKYMAIPMSPKEKKEEKEHLRWFDDLPPKT